MAFTGSLGSCQRAQAAIAVLSNAVPFAWSERNCRARAVTSSTRVSAISGEDAKCRSRSASSSLQAIGVLLSLPNLPCNPLFNVGLTARLLTTPLAQYSATLSLVKLRVGGGCVSSGDSGHMSRDIVDTSRRWPDGDSGVLGHSGSGGGPWGERGGPGPWSVKDLALRTVGSLSGRGRG